MLHRYKKGYPKLKIQAKSKNKTIKIKPNKKFKSYWNGVPATARYSLSDISLYETFFGSLFGHILIILFLWLTIFFFNLWGITPILFPRPVVKVKDIEFVLNDKTFRKKKPMPQIIAQSAPAASAESSEPTQETTVSTPSPLQNIFKQKSTSDAKSGQVKKHSDNPSVPGFSMSVPSLKSLSSGLGSSKGRGHSASSGSSSGPSIGDIDNAFSSGQGSGSGTAASSGFDKNATKKMIATYDISPYVNELKRNIRWNWKIPSENKHVELFLRIAKDGRLIILNVKKTSESAEADNAALNAVKKCLPLNPLPSKYTKSYLDVIFTFGSNSVGSRY